MKRDVLSILDLSAAELGSIVSRAQELRRMRAAGTEHRTLAGRTLGMIFEKPSTRTRISFEVGMYELGGHALFLNSQDMQLGRGEDVRDTARVLSRYVSAVMIRAFSHDTVRSLAEYATVPVINGLSDIEHPCQILADITTMQERFGSVKDLQVAWVGDGNNVCTSLILASALAGYQVRVASPEGFAPPESVLDRARKAGARFYVCQDPEEAADAADVLYTDTWVSMGEEAERTRRLKAFQGYIIDTNLIGKASADCIVMHCLPAHRGQEISDAAIEGTHSVVWDQAENRLHAQKALLEMLLSEK
jgi:ornithine carbamoyltransferase